MVKKIGKIVTSGHVFNSSSSSSNWQINFPRIKNGRRDQLEEEKNFFNSFFSFSKYFNLIKKKKKKKKKKRGKY